jgi:hypothetical protein
VDAGKLKIRWIGNRELFSYKTIIRLSRKESLLPKKAVIAAAGVSTRLLSATKEQPKEW